MALKLAFLLFCVTFIFSCSSETTTSGDITWWCSRTPHPKTCKYYVCRRHRNSSGTIISKSQFLDMTVEAALDDAVVVLNQTKRMEAKTRGGPEKVLWGSCVEYCDDTIYRLNMTLDHTREPSPLDKQTWLSAGLAGVEVCKMGFHMMNITTRAFHHISTNLTQLISNSLSLLVN